jgi:transposase
VESEYMKVAEVAKRFNVTRFTIYKWLEKGVLEGINIERPCVSCARRLIRWRRHHASSPKARPKKT